MRSARTAALMPVARVAALLLNGEELVGRGFEALLEPGEQVHRPQHFGIAPRAVDDALALRGYLGAFFRRGAAAQFAQERQRRNDQRAGHGQPAEPADGTESRSADTAASTADRRERPARAWQRTA